MTAIADSRPAPGRSRSTRLVVRLAVAGAGLGVVAGLVELLLGPEIRGWVGDKQDTTRLGLATLLLAVVALACAAALARGQDAGPGTRLLLALGLLVPGAVGFTTTGSLWYLPGALLVASGAVAAVSTWSERRAIAVEAERYCASLLVAVLALFDVFLGATALGLAGLVGIAGGLVVLGVVVMRDTLARSLSLVLLVVATLPFAALTWWSVATPVIAVLLLVTGVPALARGARRRGRDRMTTQHAEELYLRDRRRGGFFAVLGAIVGARPLVWFFVLVYLISWVLWLPLVVGHGGTHTGPGFVLLALGSLVPSAVAIALVALHHGRAGVRALLGRLLIWRVGSGWWAAVVGIAMLALGAVGLSVVFGGDAPDVKATVPAAVWLFFFSIFPGSSGGEELGWRGFALPYLQHGRSALAASVVLGLAWGTWHLPLYLTGSDVRPLSLFAPFVVTVVAMSVIYTWIYNGTGGSLLIVVLFHAASNVFLTVFVVDAFEDQLARPSLIYAALMVVAALLVVAAAGPATLSRTRTKQVGEPGQS